MYDKGRVFDTFQFWLTIKNEIFKILTYLSITLYVQNTSSHINIITDFKVL